MSLANETITPVMPATGGYGSGNNGWDDGAWWIVLFLIFAFAGSGNNGWNGGGNGGQNGYDTRADLQRGFDNQSVMNKLNGLENGISASVYDLNSTLNCSTRDILENQNANTRAILDQMCNDKIQALRDENSTLKLAASQQAQNNVLMGAMQNQTNEVLARTAPIPVPAYQVPAPYNVVPPVGGVPCPGV